MVVVFAVVSQKESFVFRRLNAIPRVARDNPTIRCFVLQGLQVFRFTCQKTHHLTPLEQVTCIAFTHKLSEIGGKQHIEDGVGLGVRQSLRHCATIYFAQCWGLFGNKLHIRLCRFQQLFESGCGRLAIFVIGVDDGPTLFLELGCFGHQHCHLHVRRGTQTESVFITVLPNHFVGEWLPRQEKYFALFGEVTQS